MRVLKILTKTYEDATGEFTKLRHTGSVKEYLSRFEKLSNKLSGLTESFCVGTFISGLREEIRFKVKRDHSQTMLEVIRRALAMADEFLFFQGKSV